MVAIIYQKDKRSGLTYAYESVSYWDKKKKQSRAKRTLIGRVDDETGEIVPTDGRGRKKKDLSSTTDRVSLTSIQNVKRFCGATYLLDMLGEKLGIIEDLRQCFPKTYQQILSIVYYLILEDKNPLYRFEKWSRLHRHPYGKNITSQLLSKLFVSITDAAKDKFFRLQGRRRAEKGLWVYDITSISSYSECLQQVQHGRSMDDGLFAQLNLALVFGETSKLPFYYRNLAGNIPDTKTINSLLTELDVPGTANKKLVMDSSFYRDENIDALLKEHLKYLIPAPMSLSFVKKELDNIYDGFRTIEHFNDQYQLYYQTVQAEWQHSQHRSKQGEDSHVYLHFYYNTDRAAEDERTLERKLLILREELESGKRVPEHEKLYKKYFTIKTIPKKGTKVIIDEKAVREAKRYYGFFALQTNEALDSVTTLELYRNKEVVENAFGNLKECLNIHRTLVASEQGLDGKLFVEFVALIYLSYIKKRMQETDLFKHYTMQGALDQLDVIECFEEPGKELIVGELLEQQKLIYESLDVAPPSKC